MAKAPKKHTANPKRVKVAIMCIAAIVIFYVGANFLKGIDVFGKKNYYYAVFENSGGLQLSAPLLVNGYKIGKVMDISLVSDNPVKICAEVLVTENIRIPKDSKFEAASQDLLGGSVLKLHLGNATEYAKSGDTLDFFATPGLTDGIDEMKTKIDNILSSVDTIGLSLKDVLHRDGGAQNLKNTLANLESTTENLNEILGQNKAKIGRLVTDLEHFSQTLNDASPKLNSVVDNFSNIADSIAKADVAAVINNANKTIEEIDLLVSKINNGEGDIGQLINNDSLYRNLEATTANINNLIIDLKQNPKRYVHFSLFGRKDKKK